MFNLGMGEIMIILVIALIFLGPTRLPDVATTLGKAIRQFRRATNDLSDQLHIDDEIRRPMQELKAALRDEPAPYQKVAPPEAAKSVTPAPAAEPKSPV